MDEDAVFPSDEAWSRVSAMVRDFEDPLGNATGRVGESDPDPLNGRSPDTPPRPRVLAIYA